MSEDTFENSWQQLSWTNINSLNKIWTEGQDQHIKNYNIKDQSELVT